METPSEPSTPEKTNRIKIFLRVKKSPAVGDSSESGASLPETTEYEVAYSTVTLSEEMMDEDLYHKKKHKKRRRKLRERLFEEAEQVKISEPEHHECDRRDLQVQHHTCVKKLKLVFGGESQTINVPEGTVLMT